MSFEGKGVSGRVSITAVIERFSNSVSIKLYSVLFKESNSLVFRCSSVDRRVHIAIADINIVSCVNDTLATKETKQRYGEGFFLTFR